MNFAFLNFVFFLQLIIGVTGRWKEWSPWSQCSKSCGWGYQLRVRSCAVPWLVACVHNSRQFDRRRCKTDCAVGAWTTWTSWSLCNSHCQRSRNRFCVDEDNPKRALDPQVCPTNMHEWSEKCGGGLCHVAHWSKWMPWSCQCLHQGLLPKRIRFRRCDGRNCEGKSYNTDECNLDEKDICALTHNKILAKEEYSNRLSKSGQREEVTEPSARPSIIPYTTDEPLLLYPRQTRTLSPTSAAANSIFFRYPRPRAITTTTPLPLLPTTTVFYQHPRTTPKYEVHRSPFEFKSTTNTYREITTGEGKPSKNEVIHTRSPPNFKSFNNNLRQVISAEIKPEDKLVAPILSPFTFKTYSNKLSKISSGKNKLGYRAPLSLRSPFAFNVTNERRESFEMTAENLQSLKTFASKSPILLDPQRFSNNELFSGFPSSLPLVPESNQITSWSPIHPPIPSSSQELHIRHQKPIMNDLNRSVHIADEFPSEVTLNRSASTYKKSPWLTRPKSIRIPSEEEVEEMTSGLIREIHWSSWGSWSGCDCLTGHQFRLRLCAYPRPAALFIHAHCPGDPVSKRACVPGQCFVVDGVWGTWSSWSDCPQNCGTGSQWRVRVCDQPLAINGGSTCPGGARDIRLCTNRRCHGNAVNGRWSSWSGWSKCQATCGKGVRSRTRHCTDPWPRNGGLYCVGDNVLSEKCSTATPCPEFSVGGWSNWSPWSECTCGNRVRSSWRSCTAPRPQGSGGACVGAMYRSQHCVTPDYCFNDFPVSPNTPLTTDI